MTPATQRKKGGNSATFLALFALLAMGLALLLLVSMVLPSLIAIIGVIYAFFFFGAVHYVLWGWWMPAAKADDDESP